MLLISSGRAGAEGETAFKDMSPAEKLAKQQEERRRSQGGGGQRRLSQHPVKAGAGAGGFATFISNDLGKTEEGKEKLKGISTVAHTRRASALPFLKPEHLPPPTPGDARQTTSTKAELPTITESDQLSVAKAAPGGNNATPNGAHLEA